MVVVLVKTGKAGSLPYLMALLKHSFSCFPYIVRSLMNHYLLLVITDLLRILDELYRNHKWKIQLHILQCR